MKPSLYENWEPWEPWEPFIETFKETEINGVRVEYHGYSESAETLEEAQSFYTPDKWEYLGASNKMWIDGVEQTGKEKTYHFFKRKYNPALVR